MLSFFWWIIVGLIAGWATGKIMGGRQGVVTDIILGIAGALVGGWIMRGLGFASRGGMIYTILVAMGGAILLTWLYRLFTKGRGRGAGTGRGDSDRDLRKVA